MSLQIHRINTQFLPIRGTPQSAGYDLHTPVTVQIAPGARQLVALGFKMVLPPGTWGHVLPRSGLAFRKGIHVGAGVIDEDYRGEVHVLLFNLGHEPVIFSPGERIAQLVIMNYQSPPLQEVNDVGMTVRNENGLGSTGQ